MDDRRFERRADLAMKAALYLRVSTDEQTVENQRPELARIAKARGFEVVRVFEETESGAKRLPVLQQLMRDANRRRFDVVMVWALDRLGRNMADVVARVLHFDRLGVVLVSHAETWLDQPEPVRSLLVSVFAWVAQQERHRLIVRTNAGLDRARARGVKLGRPRVVVNVHALAQCWVDGLTVRQASIRLGVSLATLKRAIAAQKGGYGGAVPSARKHARRVEGSKTVDIEPDPGFPIGRD